MYEIPLCSLVKKLRVGVDLFIFGGGFISLAAVCQGACTYYWINQPISASLLVVLFCATYVVYNFRVLLQYKIWAKHLHSEQVRLRCIAQNRDFIGLTIFLAIGILLLLATQLNTKTCALLATSSLIAIAYSAPILGKKGGLRQIPCLKTFLIASIWCISTLGFPISESNVHLSCLALCYLITNRFLLVFALALLFDIRDIWTDTSHHLITLATVLGSLKAKIVCMLALLIAEVAYLGYAETPNLPVSRLLWIGISLVLVFFTTPKRSIYYSLFWIDGLLILNYLIVL